MLTEQRSTNPKMGKKSLRQRSSKGRITAIILVGSIRVFQSQSIIGDVFRPVNTSLVLLGE